jgi:hypothetical protein
MMMTLDCAFTTCFSPNTKDRHYGKEDKNIHFMIMIGSNWPVQTTCGGLLAEAQPSLLRRGGSNGLGSTHKSVQRGISRLYVMVDEIGYWHMWCGQHIPHSLEISDAQLLPTI